jgi:hypothetical protein
MIPDQLDPLPDDDPLDRVDFPETGSPALPADAPVDVWAAAYTALRQVHAAQAKRLAQYEAAAAPPEPEEWKPLKRGSSLCGVSYEWTRKRINTGAFKSRREPTPRGKPGRIFVETNSLSAYWRRVRGM